MGYVMLVIAGYFVWKFRGVIKASLGLGRTVATPVGKIAQDNVVSLFQHAQKRAAAANKRLDEVANAIERKARAQAEAQINPTEVIRQTVAK